MRRGSVAGLMVGAAVCVAPTLAAAQDEAESAGKSNFMYEEGGLMGIGLAAGAKLGGGFGAPFNQLDTAFVGELEVGYNLPFLKRSFGVFLAGQYVRPTMSDSGIVDTYGASADGSRLPGDASYELTQQQAVMTLGATYRVPLNIPMFRPYVALGGRYVMMSTQIAARSGDESFGTNTEYGKAFGFYGAAGGELHLGPGAALLELQWSRVRVADQYVLRHTNVSALNLALGYRFFL